MLLVIMSSVITNGGHEEECNNATTLFNFLVSAIMLILALSVGSSVVYAPISIHQESISMADFVPTQAA